jgi:hypothetical protein
MAKAPRTSSRSFTAISLILRQTFLTNLGKTQDKSCVVILGDSSAGADDAEKARWKKATIDHRGLQLASFVFFTAWLLLTI